MPSHYLYICTNGHEEMRYRNSRRCRVCGAEIERKYAPTPDLTTWERLQKATEKIERLRVENTRLLSLLQNWAKLCPQACGQTEALMWDTEALLKALGGDHA